MTRVKHLPNHPYSNFTPTSVIALYNFASSSVVASSVSNVIYHNIISPKRQIWHFLEQKGKCVMARQRAERGNPSVSFDKGNKGLFFEIIENRYESRCVVGGNITINAIPAFDVSKPALWKDSFPSEVDIWGLGVVKSGFLGRRRREGGLAVNIEQEYEIACCLSNWFLISIRNR